MIGEDPLIIHKHNVLFCGSGISHQKATSYITQLIRAKGKVERGWGFDLAPATSIDKLKLIQTQGVREVNLHTSVYSQTGGTISPNGFLRKTFRKLKDEISAITKKDDSTATMKALEDLLVDIKIRLDGNTRASTDAKHTIDDMAELILEDLDESIQGFTITTTNGQKITADQIRVSKTISIPKDESGFSHTSAWGEMETFLSEIRRSGTDEQ